MDIATFRDSFGKKLDDLVSAKYAEYSGGLSVVPIVSEFEHIRKLSADGKRIRPYLVNTSYNTFGGTESIDHTLFAVELLHIFALIHDDIMDHSLSRHGVETANNRFRSIYKDRGLSYRLIHVGQQSFRI